MTADAVNRQLLNAGYKTRFLLFWDDFDQLDGIPGNVSVASGFKQYLGHPLIHVPDPTGRFSSWAEWVEQGFENSIAQLGVSPEIISQGARYTRHELDSIMAEAFERRGEIAKLIAPFKTQGDKGTENYSPIIIDKEGNAKLAWALDWATRWMQYKVDFEPAGNDHMVSGGSFHVASELAASYYQIEPPQGQRYAFIGFGKDQKMSGSKGNVVLPEEALSYMPAELLRWFYLRLGPTEAIPFPTGRDLFTYYDKFDKEVRSFLDGSITGSKFDEVAERLWLCIPKYMPFNVEKVRDYYVKNWGGKEIGMYFLKAVNAAQIIHLTGASVDAVVDELYQGEVPRSDLIRQRIGRAFGWLEANPHEKIDYLPSKNIQGYRELQGWEKKQIEGLVRVINAFGRGVYSDHTDFVNAVLDCAPGDKKSRPNFFKNVYTLLFGSEEGPRLTTLLWLSDEKNLKKMLELLDFSS